MEQSFKKKEQFRGKNDAYIDRDDPILKIFFNDVSKYPVISNDETLSLIVKAKNGDKPARDKIISCNIKLTIRIAKEFVSNENSLLDLIQEGCIGLDTAIDKFVPSKNITFCNYAGWWIRYRIICFIWSNKILHFPSSTRLMYKKIINATNSFYAENMRDPNIDELVSITGIKKGKILELPFYLSVSCNSSYIDPDTLCSTEPEI